MNFVKKELIPKVEKDCRAIPSREQWAVIGHSLGDLCGAYAFTKHNRIVVKPALRKRKDRFILCIGVNSANTLPKLPTSSILAKRVAYLTY